jgi:hypothetical protein
LPLFYRVFGCCRLFRREPGTALPHSTSGRLGRSVWRGRLLFYEPRCRPAFGCHQISIFVQDDGHRRGHTHILRWTSHRARGATIFNTLTKSLRRSSREAGKKYAKQKTYQPLCLRNSVMCAVWCLPCHSYRNSSQSTVRSPCSGCTKTRAKCSGFIDRHKLSHRA